MGGYVSYRRAFSRALIDLGKELKDLVVIDSDTARSTGTLAFAERFPERFINVGVSEQDLVGVAAGMAIAGLRPVASTFSMFMMRAWEQIRNTISRDRLNVKLVATHSGLSAHMDGPSHQSLEDLALMRVLPGMAVVVPADDVATYRVVVDLVRHHKGPAYVRLGRDNARRIYGDREFEFKLGGSTVLVDPEDLVIYAVGPMVYAALEAAKTLRREGIRAGVVDLYSIKPLDADFIVKIASHCSLSVTVEEHRVAGGLGSAVSEVLSERRPSRVVKIGFDNESFASSSHTYEELIRHSALDPDSIARRIVKALGGVGGA